jgi:hypothetical protein
MEQEPYPFRIVGEAYWRDPKNWAEAAVVALNPENLDEPTKLAFEAFKLDPLSPQDWRLLLRALASALFGVQKGKAGKPKVWRDSDWCELLADYYKVKAENPPHKIWGVLAARSFADRNWFNNLRRSRTTSTSASPPPGTVRRSVSRALNPEHNKYLELIAKVTARAISQRKAAAEKDARPWTERDELLTRSTACQLLIPAIEALAARRESRI